MKAKLRVSRPAMCCERQSRTNRTKDRQVLYLLTLFAGLVRRPLGVPKNFHSSRERRKRLKNRTSLPNYSRGKVTTLFVFLVWLGFCPPLVNTFPKGFLVIQKRLYKKEPTIPSPSKSIVLHTTVFPKNTRIKLLFEYEIQYYYYYNIYENPIKISLGQTLRKESLHGQTNL